MLLITSMLLLLTHFLKKGKKTITFGNSFIIGIAQAVAVIPGISRSGATIAAGLLMKSEKNQVTRFSFLMVIIPILGAAFLDLTAYDLSYKTNIELIPLCIGFFAAFISGLLACSWMINIVKKGKLIYFAIYCFIIGLIAIFAS